MNAEVQRPTPQASGAMGGVMLQTAQFDYVTQSREGQDLTRGSFTLPWPIAEGQVVRGSWESRYVGPRSETPGEEGRQIGPQIGRGSLTAERDGNDVRLSLNPQMADNNVTFHGRIDGDALSGHWDYSTFAGSTADGVFEARQQSQQQ
jgi:hypothetical protein